MISEIEKEFDELNIVKRIMLYVSIAIIAFLIVFYSIPSEVESEIFWNEHILAEGSVMLSAAQYIDTLTRKEATLTKKKRRIVWICSDCGRKHGVPVNVVSSMHMGKCDVCKKRKSVTQGRDFGVYV